MKLRYWLTGLLLTLSAWAVAHEFWLQPSQFFVTPGSTIQVHTLVGERFTGEASPGHKNRLVQYKHYWSADTDDLRTSLTADHYGEASVKLSAPGTHLLAFDNTPKFIRMAPDKFLAYLHEDGLDHVVAAREKQGTTQKPGYELYSRCAKALIQVGDVPDKAIPQAAGLPLDIVPLQNPYALKAGQRLRLQIRFNQQPLPDVLVRHWAKDEMGAVTEEAVRTDRRGEVQFRLKAGQNMVSTVQMIPAPVTPDVPETADWRSYWGSLTFGCKK